MPPQAKATVYLITNVLPMQTAAMQPFLCAMIKEGVPILVIQQIVTPMKYARLMVTSLPCVIVMPVILEVPMHLVF
jgi:hypothetical protein